MPRSYLAALLAVALFALLPGAAAHALVPRNAGAFAAGSEYLALGDSLATGVGSSRCPIGCAAKGGGGYVADFAAGLRAATGHAPTVTDLAVNGETTDSFIGDYFINPASRSQLAKAVAEIRAHAADISPVTLDIGGNDALNHRGPDHSLAEKTAVLAQADTNTRVIVATLLDALRSAGSTANLVLVGYYNPYGTDDPDLWALGQLNQNLRDTGAFYSLRVAEPYASFADNESSLTWIRCQCPLDIHPNDSGYTRMAAVLTAVTNGDGQPAGSVAGTVRTAGGKPVQGATVWYGGASTVTDRQGRYRLDGVPAAAALRFGADAGDPTTGVTASIMAPANGTVQQNFVLAAAVAATPAVYAPEKNTRAGYLRVAGALLRSAAADAGRDAQQAAQGAAPHIGPAIGGAVGHIGRTFGHLARGFAG